MPEASKVVVTPTHSRWRGAVGPVRTDSARDALLTDFGKTTLEDRYLLPGESYQDMFARVATAYADDADARAAASTTTSRSSGSCRRRRCCRNGGARARPADLLLPELGRGQPRRHRRHLERERLAGLQRRRHRHLLGRRALDRREGEGQRPDLRHHPVHPRDGLPHAGDQPGLAAPRLGGGLPRRAPSGDRGVPRDPQALGRLQPQVPEPAPRHLRSPTSSWRPCATAGRSPCAARDTSAPLKTVDARACSGRRSSRRACRPASPT